MKQCNLLYLMFLLVFFCQASGASPVKNMQRQHQLKAVKVIKKAVVDLNKATLAQLETLKGIGPQKAQAIVTYRKAHGRFEKITALTRVHGIGLKFLAQLKLGNPGRLAINKS